MWLATIKSGVCGSGVSWDTTLGAANHATKGIAIASRNTARSAPASRVHGHCGYRCAGAGPAALLEPCSIFLRSPSVSISRRSASAIGMPNRVSRAACNSTRPRLSRCTSSESRASSGSRDPSSLVMRSRMLPRPPTGATAICASSALAASAAPTSRRNTFPVEVRGKSGSGQIVQCRICWNSASCRLAARTASAASSLAPASEPRITRTATACGPCGPRPSTTAAARMRGWRSRAVSRSSG